ncbi:MAG TPA: transcriptional regulator, partial [Streptosporangiaceae bacterium]
IDAPFSEVAPCVPRILGRLEPAGAGTCRLAGTTSSPWWYAEQLATLPVAFRIVGGPEVRHTARKLGQRLLAAAGEGAFPA